MKIIKNNKKGQVSDIKRSIITLVLLGILLWIIWYFLGGTIKSIFSLVETEKSPENTFYSVEYAGIYNTKIGEIPEKCTKSGNTYSCKQGTTIKFYVGISNTGSKKRYVYASPCIIKDYSKDKKCEESDFIVSNKPCDLDPDKKTKECKVEEEFILTKGKYRLFPGAKCLPEDCYEAGSGINGIVVNYKNFLTIEVS
jgi:hypothetical protein